MTLPLCRPGAQEAPTSIHPLSPSLAILDGVFIVLFGLAFGSFLNVCISRLPFHQSVARPPSRCPRCGSPIRPADNIPILSWIILRRRCRACHIPIPRRYPAVELAAALLFLLCWLQFGLTLAGIGSMIFCLLLLGLAVMDAETMRLPDAFTWPGIATGILFSALASPHRLAAAGLALLWAAAGALFILALRWGYFLLRHTEGMGLGDVKLMAMIAAWLGPALAALSLFLGILAAAGLGLILIASRRGDRRALTMRLPFGSFLCSAALYSLFAGQPLVDWYLHFFR